MAKNNTITVKGTEIKLFNHLEEDYISLTDIAKRFNDRSEIIIQNWLRNKVTIEFLAVWEQLYNPDFKHIEFDVFRSEAGSNAFLLSPKQWIEKTAAIGLKSKPGRYGGTFAHKDIALAFCYWLSPPFQLYLIREFQRLKEEEARHHDLKWDVHRIISKANYHIHTEAIKEYLIPPLIAGTKKQAIVFASEADLINLALFGLTAKQWQSKNPEAKGNLRDHSTTEQLLVLSNLESLNAKLIEWDCDREQRLEILNKTAIQQMEILIKFGTVNKLPSTPSRNLF